VGVNYFYLRQPCEINVPVVSNLPHSGYAIISVPDPKHFGTDPDPEFEIRAVPYGSGAVSGSLPVFRMSEEHLSLANF
jgi:hypothetical protein